MFLKVGVYGISGAGKTTLVKKLESKYPSVISYRDGSEVISEYIEIDEFKKLSCENKRKYRKRAIETLKGIFSNNKSKHLFVTGHYSFWEREKEIAWTNEDACFYDVIFFMYREPERIIKNTINDCRERNSILSVEDIRKWQVFDQEETEKICREANINFYLINADLNYVDIEKIIIQKISELSVKAIARIIFQQNHRKIAIFDCDGTLNREESFSLVDNSIFNNKKITEIFKSYNEYCFDAFFDVSELILKNNRGYTFSKKVKINSSIINQIESLKKQEFSFFVFISSGLPEVWKHAISNIKIQNKLIVGGACFAKHGIIVSNDIKGKLVSNLISLGCVVSSFGNALNDFEMLLYSNYANVVYEFKPKASLINKLKENNKSYGFVKLR